MTTKEKHVNPTLNQASPYFLHPTDTGLKIVTNLFNVVGFKSWKRAVTIALSGKNKLGFVDSTVKCSTTSSSLGKAWDKVNDMVIGWLLNAMDEKVSGSVLYFKTAKEIWDELEHRFGQSSSALLFSVEEHIGKINQSCNNSIEDFYTQIKGLWDEVDALDPLPVCSCKSSECEISSKILKSQQRRRLIQFLIKLDDRYHQARSSILMLKDVPTVSEAYGILLQEQTHQEISKGGHTSANEEGIACRVHKRKSTDNRSKFGNKRANTNFNCEHCKLHGHTLDMCWKVHGYPPNFKSNTWKKENSTTGKANSVHNDNDAKNQGLVDAKFTPEQFSQLLALLDRQKTIANVLAKSASPILHILHVSIV